MSYISFRAQKQRDSYFAKEKQLNWDASPRSPDIFSSFPTSFALDHPNVSPCGCFFAQKAIADSFVKDWTGPGPAEHDQVLVNCASDCQQVLHLGFSRNTNEPTNSLFWVTDQFAARFWRFISLNTDRDREQKLDFWASKFSKRITVTFLTDGLRGPVEGLGQCQ